MGTVHYIDPTREQHFALSQNDHFRLQNLNNAMIAVAAMVERNPGEESAELEGEWLGGLFRVFSDQLEDILARSPFAGESRPLPGR